MNAMTDDTKGAGRAAQYEQARAELASVVERLEAGGTSLEESLALWERGEALAVICQRWLDGARARIDAARQEPAPRSNAELGSRDPGSGIPA